MKKSIKIFAAILFAVTLISLYHASHHPLNGFDLCIFISLIFVGVMIGRNEETPVEDSKITAGHSEFVEVLKKSDEKAKNWRQQLEMDRKNALPKYVETLGGDDPFKSYMQGKFDFILDEINSGFRKMAQTDFREGVEL